MANGMITRKVKSFLASPHTYPKSGLPFGENGGGIAAGRPSRSATTNIMPVGNVGANTAAPKLLNTNEQLSANFTVKSANINEQSPNMTNKIDGGTIAKIRQLALEKCAGDEKLAESFMEGFFDEVMTKQAAPEISLVGEMGKGFMNNIGKGMAGLAMGMGAMSVGKAFTGAMNDRLHGQFVNALRTAIQTNPILRQAKKEKVVNYAETIFKFAPHVATDANLLSSVLANAVHGEGIDPMTLKSLSELESRYKDNTNDNQAFSPKSYV
jgi:hypothetical protein